MQTFAGCLVLVVEDEPLVALDIAVMPGKAASSMDA
jgi:hypothetical protein